MPEPDNTNPDASYSDNARTRLRIDFSSNSFKDLLVIAFISLITFFLATEYNAFERIHAFSRQHEDMELDEIFTLLMILSVALSVFSFRRIIELRNEVHIRQLAEDKIRKLAYYDNLTGLANRTLLKDRLLHIMTHARRYKTILAVLFIDLDDFKLINDTLGHNYGDEVLKNVAQRLLASVREIDTVARLGGDEFIVVLEGVNEIQEIEIIAKRISDALKRHHLLAEQKVYATPSIGISVYPNDGNTCDILIKQADTAMYKSKSRGKGQIQFYSK